MVVKKEVEDVKKSVEVMKKEGVPRVKIADVVSKTFVELMAREKERDETEKQQRRKAHERKTKMSEGGDGKG